MMTIELHGLAETAPLSMTKTRSGNPDEVTDAGREGPS